MFRRFISEEKVRARLLSFPDGERRLTNILHLSEIVHKVSFGNGDHDVGEVDFAPARPRHAPAREHQLRLESDAEAARS